MELLDAGLSAGTAATFHRILRNLPGLLPLARDFGVPKKSRDSRPAAASHGSRDL